MDQQLQQVEEENNKLLQRVSELKNEASSTRQLFMNQNEELENSLGELNKQLTEEKNKQDQLRQELNSLAERERQMKGNI